MVAERNGFERKCPLADFVTGPHSTLSDGKESDLLLQDCWPCRSEEAGWFWCLHGCVLSTRGAAGASGQGESSRGFSEGQAGTSL